MVEAGPGEEVHKKQAAQKMKVTARWVRTLVKKRKTPRRWGTGARLTRTPFEPQDSGEDPQASHDHSPARVRRFRTDPGQRVPGGEQLTDIRVEILRGSALVEVSENMKANPVTAIMGGSETVLWKKGLYRERELLGRARV